MHQYDKSSKWLIQHHGDSILRLAGVLDIDSWQPLPAELVQSRRLPDGLIEVRRNGQAEPDLYVLEIATYYPGKRDHHKRLTTENTARPSRRKILNHGKHGTTRKGDPNVFPFLCPSVLSVVITCLYNRRAAQRDRTCRTEGHGKGKAIRIFFSVYFGGFRG